MDASVRPRHGLVGADDYAASTEPCGAAIRQFEKSERGVGIELLINRERESLLMHAARKGFHTLTVAEMQHLVRFERVPYPGAMPKRESDLARLLVTWQFPGASDAEIDAMLAYRGKQRAPRHHHVLSAENAPAVENCLAEADVLEFKGSTAAATRGTLPLQSASVSSGEVVNQPPVDSVGVGLAERVDAPPVQPSASGSSSDRVVGARESRDVVMGDITREAARNYLPPVGHCELYIYKGKAWVLKSKDKADWPKSRTVKFSGDDRQSCIKALGEVLEWAWNWSAQQGHGECPFNLAPLRSGEF